MNDKKLRFYSPVSLYSYLKPTACSLKPKLLLIPALSLIATEAMAGIMPEITAGKFWVDADHPKLEELDPRILERLAALGTVQQFRAHPDSPLYEATTMVLIQAPVERVWKVLIDLDNRPRILPEIYTSCRIKERRENELVTEEKFKVSVPPFSWNLEGSHLYRLDPENWRADLEMIEGDIKGSKGWLILIPASNKDTTIALFQHYGEMRYIDLVTRLFLRFTPQFSLPAILAEGVTLMQGLRREAEAGPKGLEELNIPYKKPEPWSEVDLEILKAMSEHRLYIHQDMEDGQPLCTAAAWRIPAPKDEVWRAITEFEQWDKYQKEVGVKNHILSRQEDQVRLMQVLSYKVFYIFGVDLKIEYEYNLIPTDKILFLSPDPTYEGTRGEWNLREADEGDTTYLVINANIYIQKATGASKMLGETDNPMPVRQAHNMMGVQILGAPIAEEITRQKSEVPQ